MTREILAMNGIDPRKDVVIQGTGTGAIRLAAVIGGSLDAAITNPTESLAARKQGLNELFSMAITISTSSPAARRSLNECLKKSRIWFGVFSVAH
jgi:hypothetical protein